MDKASQRLGREDWILAGFRALVAGGPEAVRVEPVARGLGLTKGSFYWHFAGLAEWHAAMLAYWEARAFSDIVAALAQVFPDRPVRAALLFTEGPALIAIPDAMIALHRPKASLALNPDVIAPI